MTTTRSIPQQETSLSQSKGPLGRLPGVAFLRNLPIGHKLTIGFGILVVLTLSVVGFSYIGSLTATENIDRTGDVRVPTALASARAQADLLRMLGDVRGYLALGDREFRTSYEQVRQAFERDLAELEALSPNLSPANKTRLENLQAEFVAWSELPETLFELRDDQLEREPAYRLLATDGSRYGGYVLIGVKNLIETQAQRTPSAENMALMKDMANFQGSFAGMLSGLRGYVTTRNHRFREEYEVNLTLNEVAWERLLSQRNLLSTSQQATLDEVTENRQTFLELPDQIFDIMESERYREDLYLFSTEAIPLAENMQRLLAEMTQNQQDALETELLVGRIGLARANRQTLTGGIVALILGVGFAFIFRENIAGPIRRLTHVAEQVRAGDLEAQASVESRDEIGTLAETFNSMTSKLRQSLFQVRKEKKRADDLLDVVIPIGVELSFEKDFNLLLEKMLLEAKAFCYADAGTLYLRNEQDCLEFVIVRNDTLNIALGGTSGSKIPYDPIPLYQENGEPNRAAIVTQTALLGRSINYPTTDSEASLSLSGTHVFDREGYQTEAHLTIPLKNAQETVVGVMQLINPKDPETGQIVKFDQNLQRMMESFSSLAVAALEAYIREQQLQQEIRQLRIEIDEAKRQEEVDEIVSTDFFQELQNKAKEMRRRGRRARQDKSDTEE